MTEWPLNEFKWHWDDGIDKDDNRLRFASFWGHSGFLSLDIASVISAWIRMMVERGWNEPGMMVFFGGNPPTFAPPPSSFRPRSGVILKSPFLPERHWMTPERGTRSEWQERKTERHYNSDHSTHVPHRSGSLPLTVRVVPAMFLSFLIRSCHSAERGPLVVPSRSLTKRPGNKRIFRFWVIPF